MHLLEKMTDGTEKGYYDNGRLYRIIKPDNTKAIYRNNGTLEYANGCHYHKDGITKLRKYFSDDTKREYKV